MCTLIAESGIIFVSENVHVRDAATLCAVSFTYLVCSDGLMLPLMTASGGLGQVYSVARFTVSFRLQGSAQRSKNDWSIPLPDEELATE